MLELSRYFRVSIIDTQQVVGSLQFRQVDLRALAFTSRRLLLLLLQKRFEHRTKQIRTADGGLSLLCALRACQQLHRFSVR